MSLNDVAVIDVTNLSGGPLDTANTVSVNVPGASTVLTVAIPGIQGPPGVFKLGTVTTGAPGSDASATQGVDGDGVATVNLTIPRGDTGAIGPANTLTIGTVTTGANGVPASATLTGSAPNQTLSLVLPKGDQGPTGATGAQGIQGIQGPQGNPGTDGRDGAGIQIAGQVASYSALPTGLTSADAGKAYLNTADGKLYVWTGSAFPANGSGTTFTGPAGPANALTIGTVTNGSAGGAASATLTGTAPNQVLNLTLPTGATGPANVLTIGSVVTGASGSNAAATITGSAPTQTLNLTIPKGDVGPAGPMGATGNGVLVLGASDPVPNGTPVGTVIYRPAMKTATFYWGSGTSVPSSGMGAGDTYYHTGLGGLLRYNGFAWRHLGPVTVADSNARLAISNNYGSAIYAGFQVRQTSDGWTYEWNGAVWIPLYFGNADATWTSVGGGGTAPAFQSSWANFNAGYQTARFIRNTSGEVVLQGVVAGGTISSSAAIFALPAGYRPSAIHIFTVMTNGTTTGRVDVTSAGLVLAAQGSNAWLSLDGIRFSAEQ